MAFVWLKYGVVHRHVLGVGGALVDEGEAAVAEVGPGPGGVGPSRLGAVVLGPADHELAVDGVEGEALELGGVEAVVVEARPGQPAVGRLPDPAVVGLVDDGGVRGRGHDGVGVGVQAVVESARRSRRRRWSACRSASRCCCAAPPDVDEVGVAGGRSRWAGRRGTGFRRTAAPPGKRADQVTPPSVDLRTAPEPVVQLEPAKFADSPVAATTVTVEPTLLMARLTRTALLRVAMAAVTLAKVGGDRQGVRRAIEAALVAGRRPGAGPP